MSTFTIFGKQSCGYCRRAKELCEIHNQPYRYVDIEKAGITQADLEVTVGKPVLTVPQIFRDKSYVGGFEELSSLLKNHA